MRAIAGAREVKNSDPLYKQAQQNIERWSQVILDIAMDRAQKGNLADAIAAAKMVPPDQTEVLARAQEKIAVWEEQYKLEQGNKQLLEDALRLIRPGQASSYSRAIGMLREIEPGEPYYKEARDRIEWWSQRIWQIASRRARRRRIPSAIEAAVLVPADTATRDKAQQAIAKWKGQ